MASTPLLEVRGLDVFYGRVQVLRGVGLHVTPGELVTIVGPNGAGKTTLLRAITGLRPRPVKVFAGSKADHPKPRPIRGPTAEVLPSQKRAEDFGATWVCLNDRVLGPGIDEERFIQPRFDSAQRLDP